MDKAMQGRRYRKSGEKAPLFRWPFTRINLIVVLAALLVIAIGYLFLGHGPYDSVQSRTIAPVLLIIGYLVLLPIGLIIREKRPRE